MTSGKFRAACEDCDYLSPICDTYYNAEHYQVRHDDLHDDSERKRIHRNHNARERYSAMRSLGMAKTPYGWE